MHPQVLVYNPNNRDCPENHAQPDRAGHLLRYVSVLTHKLEMDLSWVFRILNDPTAAAMLAMAESDPDSAKVEYYNRKMARSVLADLGPVLGDILQCSVEQDWLSKRNDFGARTVELSSSERPYVFWDREREYIGMSTHIFTLRAGSHCFGPKRRGDYICE